MAEAESLKRVIKVCMFDQYGTVVDMQTGLWKVAVDFLKAKGWHGNAYEFVTWWRRTQFENPMIDALLDRQHTSYRAIGHLSVRHVLNRARIEHTEDEVRWLVSCIERLKCLPRFRQPSPGCKPDIKLAVLSDGDPDMLEAARNFHGIPFDAVISVADANAFKPHRATYERAARKMGVARDQVLFVANHEYDCVGAKAAGMHVAFIDRRRRPFASWPHQPDLILPSVTALADTLV
jgi:2-haloacid dehalogenase